MILHNWQNVVLRWERILGYIQCFIVVSSRTDPTDQKSAVCQFDKLWEIFIIEEFKMATTEIPFFQDNIIQLLSRQKGT